MARRSVLWLVWWLSLALPLVAHAGLREDMVKFDQAYIPVLVMSAQDKPQSEAAMEVLLTRWDWFKQRQAYQQSRDPQWGFDLAHIEQRLLEAQRWLQEQDYPRAHRALERVHEIMVQARARIGLAYFPDALWRFHAPMEKLIAASKALPDMSQDLKPLFDPNLAKARKLWQAVLDWPFNPYDYGLDWHHGKTLRKQLLSEQDDLRDLARSLDDGKRLAAAKSLAKIRDGFLTIFSSFGHFPASAEAAASH